MAKKSKNPEQNSEDTSSGFDFFKKIFKPLKILFEIHLKLALGELKKDAKRFISGFFSLLIGCFFLITFYFLLNVLLITLLNEILDLKFLKLFFCVLIDTGVNLFFAIIFIVAGKNMFKKPFFSDTKKIIDDTLKEIKK